jgi:hypothetical protein
MGGIRWKVAALVPLAALARPELAGACSCASPALDVEVETVRVDGEPTDLPHGWPHSARLTDGRLVDAAGGDFSLELEVP